MAFPKISSNATTSNYPYPGIAAKPAAKRKKAVAKKPAAAKKSVAAKAPKVKVESKYASKSQHDKLRSEFDALKAILSGTVNRSFDEADA